MAPPPVPSGRKPSISITTKLLPPGSMLTPVDQHRHVEKISKKRKDATRLPGNIDDMLGEEIDAMDRAHQTDAFDALLEAPKSKKPKLPSSQTIYSQKELQARLPFPSPSLKSRQHAAGTTVKAFDSRQSEYSLSSSPSAIVSHPPEVVAPAQAAYFQPIAPEDLPPTIQNSIPFKGKRSRTLVGALIKDPKSSLVCTAM